MGRLRATWKRLTTGTRRSVTVRYMFPAFALFAAILGASAVVGPDESYIRLEASDTTVEAGDRFTMHIYANAHVPVNAVDITLRFDEELVEVLEVDRGQSVLTIWTEDPIVESDRIILRGGTFRRGFLGEHKIASIDLRASETGQSRFSVSDVVLLAGDGSGTAVRVSEGPDPTVSLFVYDENTDPSSIGVDVEVRVVTDINGDGNVTLQDVSAFMAAWNSRDTVYDFNNDGQMTFRDFSIILAALFFN